MGLHSGGRTRWIGACSLAQRRKGHIPAEALCVDLSY